MRRTITVSGRGSVVARPDLATISVGVQVRAANAQHAFRGANERTAAVIDALRGAGVPSEGLRTNGPHLWVMDRGYQASNDITVVVRDLDRVGEVIDAAAGAGGEHFTMGGVSFAVSEAATLLGPARAAAVADALSKATELAAAAGLAVGDVVSILEGGGASVPMPRMLMAESMSKAAVAVEPGEHSLAVDVTVTYRLVDSQ